MLRGKIDKIVIIILSILPRSILFILFILFFYLEAFVIRCLRTKGIMPPFS